MKKYLAIIALASGVLLGSCSKKLELTPEYQLDGSQPLTSIDQVEFATKGMYSALRSIQLYGSLNDELSAFAAMPDIMSDNLIETFESLGNQRRYSEWTYTSDDGNIYAAWVAAYQIIARTNIIIRDADQFAANNQQKVNRCKGQALALRAHMHFELLRYFSGSYRRNSDTLAIPYVKVYDVTYKPARNTVKECYDNLLADLTQAKTMLSNVDQPVNSGDSKAYIDVNAVDAMLARVNFYAGNWTDAIAAANNAIAAKPLASAPAFAAIWTDQSREEVFWTINFENSNEGSPYGGVYSPVTDRNIYRPAPDLLALYNTATDVRYGAYFGNVSGRTVVLKHVGPNGDGAAYWKAYRTGEMYLILAESYYNSSNEGSARNALNDLRVARIGGFVPGTETGAALFNAIQTERRKELAFEADRFFTLKRLGRLPIARSACGTSGNSPSSICSLASDSRAWVWPIPYNELTVNPNLVKNPGY